MVASLPLLVKRTASAVGTIRQKRSDASISDGVAAAKCEPSAIDCETTSTILGCECPWMSAPNDIMKSTYSFPSRSQTCDPRPRSNTTGPGEYTAAPRDGEFTPSISDCCARSYHSRDRSRVFVFFVAFVFIEVRK